MRRPCSLVFLLLLLDVAHGFAGLAAARRKHVSSSSVRLAAVASPRAAVTTRGRAAATSRRGFFGRRKSSKDDDEQEEKVVLTDEEKKQKRKEKWTRLRSLVTGEGPLLGFAAICLFLAAVSEVGVPHYSSRALNAIVVNAAARANGEAASRSVARELYGLLAASSGAALFAGLRGASFWIAGGRVVSRLRLRMFRNLLAQELGYFDAVSTGELNSRLTSDATKVADVVSFNLNILARQSIQSIGGVCYLFWLDGPLAALALLWMGLASAMTAVYGGFARRLARAAQDSLAEAASVANEALTNVRVVRAFGAERATARRYADTVRRTNALQQRHGLGYGVSRVALGAARAGSTVALLALGAHRCATGAIDSERLVTFVFYSSFVNSAAFDVGEQWARVEEALAAGAAAFDVAHRQPEWRGKSKPSAMVHSAQDDLLLLATNAPAAVEKEQTSYDEYAESRRRTKKLGTVAFEDVSFTYPQRKKERVLRKVSIEVRPGEKVALVGESGSGKSTLTRLLLRHFETDSGSVTLDGRDVVDIPHSELTSRVAYVEQEPQLFSGTIADNIRFGLEEGDPRASRESVERAAQLVGVTEFSKLLPEGLDTPVGQGGAFQSGGQRQRLAIARALVRDPDVIVLDEPSSALDARTEQLVQAALDATNCTMLVVAHRLATIKEADRIYVLDRGAVVEMGTHDELMAEDGNYANMVSRQSFAPATTTEKSDEEEDKEGDLLHSPADDLSTNATVLTVV